MDDISPASMNPFYLLSHLKQLIQHAAYDDVLHLLRAHLQTPPDKGPARTGNVIPLRGKSPYAHQDEKQRMVKALIAYIEEQEKPLQDAIAHAQQQRMGDERTYHVAERLLAVTTGSEETKSSLFDKLHTCLTRSGRDRQNEQAHAREAFATYADLFQETTSHPILPDEQANLRALQNLRHAIEKDAFFREFPPSELDKLVALAETYYPEA